VLDGQRHVFISFTVESGSIPLGSASNINGPAVPFKFVSSKRCERMRLLTGKMSD